VLRNPASRAEYDHAHALHAHAPGYELPPLHDGAGTGAGGDDRTALDDNEAHARILMLLYRKRRDHARDAGIAAYYLQQMLGCSDDLFEFHSWYLKAKGWVAIDEQGSLAITIEGIDHVISLSRTHAVEKLLIGRPTDLGDRGEDIGD
jgi:curved DNA-binding protein